MSILSSPSIIRSLSRLRIRGPDRLIQFYRHGYIMSHSPPILRDPSLFKTNLVYINGRWLEAKSRMTFEVHDPCSGELIGTAPECNAEDTLTAIDAAAEAFPIFRTKTGRERSKILRRWYELMIQNVDDIAKLITWENGKPLADAKGEVVYAANFVEWFSEEAPRICGDTILSSSAENSVITVKEPIGVCGLITPWNFPAAMLTRKVAPALAAGCSVVIKSPGETPFTALALVELAHRAGVPKGVINVVSALENTVAVGEVLTTSPTVKKISFTGSTSVGKILMRQSSSTLKKLSLELGGNAPFIIFDDADIELATKGAINSKFRSSGQTCVCANRIFVQTSIHDKFVKNLVAHVQGFRVGGGFTEGVTQGPLIHKRAVARVDSHVRDAERKGGIVVQGGRVMKELGPNFYQPTVITNMSTEMTLASEETFGPVAGIFKFDTEEEAIKLANLSPAGLAGYIFSRDIHRVTRVVGALETGMVGVNTGLISDPAVPFGGVKESGFGKEGSKYGIGEYQVTKAITYGNLQKLASI
ncbi:BgTH12-07523 [Blumeria graminis f. sp. triticale]|nr:BgTH12-07523 [Blumeria graminis f. sp. triticale]